ncbi:DUF2971 domain-containing protein [Dyella solisilvae]|nr:DUF2971 domain-containing protein [Dyella solisilvae]
MQVNLQARFDLDRVVQMTLDKMWARCLGQGTTAQNEMGAILDLTAALHRKGGREKFNKGQAPGVIKTLEGLPNVMVNLNKEVQKALAETKILCLSAVRDSILMWSHYAESHQGLALEFGSPEGVDSPYKVARRVNYCGEVPCLFDEDELSEFISGGLRLTHDLALKTLYAKAAAWEYESEWRIDTGPGRDAGAEFEDVPFHPLELRAVYFGCKAAGDFRQFVGDIVGERFAHAEVWECRRSVDAWSLSFSRLQ